MPKLLILLLAAAALVGLSFTVLSKSPQAPTVETTPTPTTPSEESGDHPGYEEPAAGHEEFLISIGATGFSPQNTTVTTNNSISFSNADTEAHAPKADVGADNKPLFELSELLPGQTLSIGDIHEPGTYTYYCDIHPDEKGTIIVQ